MTKPIVMWPTFLLAFSFSFNARSCEPIVPLCVLLSGSSAAGPALLMHSALWLFVAVALKCGAFAFFDHRLPWRRAVPYMLVANVVSTIPGVLVAALTASIGGIILAIPLVFVLGSMVRRRVLLLPARGPFHWMSGGVLALAFTLFFFGSAATFGLAGKALTEGSFATYWILKFLFVTLAAGTGILISAVLEECVIAGLSSKSEGNTSFCTTVLRANYVTFAVILFVAALETWPKRLHASHFIVSWLRGIFAFAMA